MISIEKIIVFDVHISNRVLGHVRVLSHVYFDYIHRSV